MVNSHVLAEETIIVLQQYIAQLGYRPVIHFELEGCYQPPVNEHANVPFSLNYQQINLQLSHLGIDGELVPEFWSNQWEYVSKFNGQSPLKEAQNLTQAIHILPKLFAQQGIENTLIKPVVWGGDKGKLANEGGNVFTTDNRAVHIPNAVQINISAVDGNGFNIINKQSFGEYLQQCFLKTSLSCCLLYLPEEDAYERLKLKSKYGLADELCSPTDISGGHQGSIALYKKVGKHNQAMGEETLLYDQHQQVLLSELNWEKTARIEHRLGASSIQYNAFNNIIYALLNLIDALDVYERNDCVRKIRQHADFDKPKELPTSLFDKNERLGAINLFENDKWFNERLNEISIYMNGSSLLGDRVKQAILMPYRQNKLIYIN
jgi:hypothetical protein